MADHVRRVLLKNIPTWLIGFVASVPAAAAALQTPGAARRVQVNVPTQPNWRWCAKCQGLWFNGNSAKGPCPAGGSHEVGRSSNYSLVHDAPVGGAQGNWRWCQKCQGLWFNGNEAKGVCPAGGTHESAASSDYVVAQSASAGGTQENWRWCQKCQGLWFNGNSAKGRCAAGGAHDATGSSNYRLTQIG